MSFIDPRRRPFAGIVLLILVLALAAGCASPGAAVHPGAANATDSAMYDALVSIQASIESAKLDFASDPRAKVPLNKLISSYNLAMESYKTYHAAAVSGHPPDPATLQAQIAALIQDVAAVQTQFGEGAKP